MRVGGLAVLEEGESGIFGGAEGELEASCYDDWLDEYLLRAVAFSMVIVVQYLHWRSDQKVEYFPLSASSSTTTSKLLPDADNAETKLRRPKNRPKKKDRIVVEGGV